jgi:coiled-coil domain-containing protein 12
MAEADRRERLQALRAAAAAAVEEEGQGGGPAGAGAGAGAGADESEAEPVLRFRNYVVKDQKGIAHVDVAPPRVAPIDTVLARPAAAAAGDEDEGAGAAGAAAAAAPLPVDQLDAEQLLAGAAKSANADLKREVAPKLAKLERQTARAMLQIMREEERQRHVAAGGAAD